MKMEEFIAWIRHIAWCGYQIAAKQNFNVIPTDEQWESLLSGVEFALNHPGMTPEQSHESWMTKRLNDGWVLGEFINPISKTHPNMKPFGQLPEIERRKDLMGVMAQNLGMKLWSEIMNDNRISVDDVVAGIKKANELGFTAGQIPPAGGIDTSVVKRRGDQLMCKGCRVALERKPGEFGFHCPKCGFKVTDAELVRPLRKPLTTDGPPMRIEEIATTEDHRRRYPDRKPRGRVMPMPEVDPDAGAVGRPGFKPIKIKPLPGVDGTRHMYNSYGDKMRKFRCAVYLQHKYSNEPGFNQVLITVGILRGRWSKPAKPAVVVEVCATDKDQAEEIALDMFRSLMSMKQIGELEGKQK